MSQVEEQSYLYAEFRNFFSLRQEYRQLTIIATDSAGTHFSWEDPRGIRHFGVISDLIAPLKSNKPHVLGSAAEHTGLLDLTQLVSHGDTQHSFPIDQTHTHIGTIIGFDGVLTGTKGTVYTNATASFTSILTSSALALDTNLLLATFQVKVDAAATIGEIKWQDTSTPATIQNVYQVKGQTADIPGAIMATFAPAANKNIALQARVTTTGAGETITVTVANIRVLQINPTLSISVG